MKILILYQYYWPEGYFRTTILAEEMLKRGHEVEVITGFPNWPDGKLYEGYKISLWEKMNIRGVNVLRVALYPSHEWSIIKRFLNYGSFMVTASLFGILFSNKADILYAYHPPLSIGIPAMLISKIKGIPMVYGVMDLWPEALIAAGIKIPKFGLSFLKTLEKQIYNFASYVIVLSQGYRQNLLKKGVPAHKVKVVPIWGDEELYKPESRNSVLATEYGFNNFFNVMYVGNIGEPQALKTLIDAAHILKDISDIQFVLIGSGVNEDVLKEQVACLELKNVRFLGRKKPEHVAKYLAFGDAMVVHLVDKPMYQVAIPSKTMTYMACGRPIIMGVKGEAAELIEQTKSGITCLPENAESLAEAIQYLYALSYKEREEMGDNAREAFLEKFTSNILIDQYEMIFEGCINKLSCATLQQNPFR